MHRDRLCGNSYACAVQKVALTEPFLWIVDVPAEACACTLSIKPYIRKEQQQSHKYILVRRTPEYYYCAYKKYSVLFLYDSHRGEYDNTATSLTQHNKGEQKSNVSH